MHGLTPARMCNAVTLPGDAAGVVRVEETMGSIGCQAWPAGKVMAQWALRKLPEDAVVLELGAGTGLASIALAKSGRRVIASDFSQLAIENLRENAGRNGIGTNMLEVVCWDFEKELPDRLRGRGVTHVIGADIWLPSASQGHGLARGIRSLWDEYGEDTLEATHLVLAWRPKLGTRSIFDDMQAKLKAVGLESTQEPRPWANAGIVHANTPSAGEVEEIQPPPGIFWSSWWKWWILPTLQLHTIKPLSSSSPSQSSSISSLSMFSSLWNRKLWNQKRRRLEAHVALRPNTLRTTAHDNVIPANAKGKKVSRDVSLLDRIKAETLVAHAAATTTESGSATVAVGKTWWFDPCSREPRCAIEEAIAMLHENVLIPECAEIMSSSSSNAGKALVVGAEWWVQHRRIDRPLYFHLDTDVGRHETRVRCPSLSSILFLSDTGGPTCILGQRPTESRWTGKLQLSPAEATEADVVFPKAGRYVLFKGDLLHGVLPPPPSSEKVVPQETTSGSNMRTTLLINWWVGDKPLSPQCSSPSVEFLARLRDASSEWSDGKKNICEIAGKQVSTEPHPTGVQLAMTDLQAGGALGKRGQVQCAKLTLDVDLGSAIEAQDGLVNTSMYLPIELVEGVPPHGEIVGGAHRITGMGRVRLVENQLP